MFLKYFIVFLVVNLVLDFSYGQRNIKFFRKDYHYIQESESFYKIHTLPKTWCDATRVCSLEGASLYYPENNNEARQVLSYWNKTQPFPFIYVGISDLVAKGVFETIDGKPVSDVFNKWSPGEPNDAGGVEDCVVMNREGLLNDDLCFKKFPFICKKSLQSLQWNRECNIPNLDYTYNKTLGRCYKFHTTPLNWTEAYAVCSAEQSYLAVINSQSEADLFVAMMANARKDLTTAKYLRGAVHSGFHNRGDEGWRTVKGTSLDDSGYSMWLWGNNQPVGGDREQCGSISYNGHLNDISCDTRCFFICEHEVDWLDSVFNFRIVGPPRVP